MSVQKFANDATAYLSGTFSIGATSLTLQSGGEKFPYVTNGVDYFVIALEDDTGAIEYCRVNTHEDTSPNVFSDIDRGIDDTVDGEWAGVVRVECRLIASTLDEFLQKSGGTLTGNVVGGGNDITDLGTVETDSLVANTSVQAAQIIGILRGAIGATGNQIVIPPNGTGTPTIGGQGIWFGTPGGLFNPASKASVGHGHDTLDYPVADNEGAGWTSDPGGAMADLTVTNTRFPMGNVLRYGADRDGLVDSTIAFENAAKSGASEIEVPGGTFLTERVLLRNRQTIRGRGPYKTTLKLPNNSIGTFTAKGMMCITNVDSPCNWVSVQDLTWDGNESGNTGWTGAASNYAAYGIYFGTRGGREAPTHAYINNVHINRTINDCIAEDETNVEANNLVLGFSVAGGFVRGGTYSYTGSSVYNNIICEGFWNGYGLTLNGHVMTNVRFRVDAANPYTATRGLARDGFVSSTGVDVINGLSCANVDPTKFRNNKVIGFYSALALQASKILMGLSTGTSRTFRLLETVEDTTHRQTSIRDVVLTNMPSDFSLWAHTANDPQTSVSGVLIDRVNVKYFNGQVVDPARFLVSLGASVRASKVTNVVTLGAGAGGIVSMVSGANASAVGGLRLENFDVESGGTGCVNLTSNNSIAAVVMRDMNIRGSATLSSSLWWNAAFKKRGCYFGGQGYTNYSFRQTVPGNSTVTQDIFGTTRLGLPVTVFNTTGAIVTEFGVLGEFLVRTNAGDGVYRYSCQALRRSAPGYTLSGENSYDNGVVTINTNKQLVLTALTSASNSNNSVFTEWNGSVWVPGAE